MKNVLISVIGNNDCKLSEGTEGAILSILKKTPFDTLYLLYNKDYYLKYCSDILVYCRKEYPKLEVRYEPIYAIDPTNYNMVYPSMCQAVEKIKKEENKAKFTVSVTSGTPTMHACWLLIVQGGILQADLIQVSIQSGITPINFTLDDFPLISVPDEVKTKLTSVSRENTFLKNKFGLHFDDIVGQHTSIKNLKEAIIAIAPYDISVFINGESGTGKELIAQAIHRNSSRKEKPFIPVNCGAISENLFESSFFGHKTGAFTGAISDHSGFFSDANEGTLFLDEIAELPLALQTKLLRVLENGEVQPIGGAVKQVDVRLITATHKNLKNLIQEKKFREDLYYRLVQAKMELPPLRERGTDIILLAHYILDQINQNRGQIKIFDSQAEEKLLKHHWKGNIRELKNVLNVAWIMTTDNIIKEKNIQLESLSDYIQDIFIPSEGIDLDGDIIPKYYQAALNITQGNASQAAKLLNIEPHTFRARLKKIGAK